MTQVHQGQIQNLALFQLLDQSLSISSDYEQTKQTGLALPKQWSL